ncbi:MAG: single-stranded DNA-binding protein [Exilispira sp.]|jgi:single-strand DNA-binding protein|nr:single-stranded DNA-binding protein [Exilispira sp.]
MSNDINKIIISGRLTRDPIRTEVVTQNGPTIILKFSIANQTYKSNEGSFFDCNFWGKRAEYFSNKLSKGALVLIEGELKQDRWKDKNTSENRSKIVINVLNLFLLNFERSTSFKENEYNNKEIYNNEKKTNNSYDNDKDDLPIKSADEIDGESLNSLSNFNTFNDIDEPFDMDNFEDENNKYYR